VVRHVERAVAGGHDRRVVDLPGEELADRGGDLLDMGLQGEVTGVDKTNVSVGDVALEGLPELSPAPAVTLSSAAGGCLIPNGSWCLPSSSVMPRRVRRRCPDDKAGLTSYPQMTWVGAEIGRICASTCFGDCRAAFR
jgi:hypothetical protein